MLLEEHAIAALRRGAVGQPDRDRAAGQAPGISFSGVSVTLIAPDWAEASDPALTTSVPLASCAALEPLPSARTATPSRRALRG